MKRFVLFFIILVVFADRLYANTAPYIVAGHPNPATLYLKLREEYIVKLDTVFADDDGDLLTYAIKNNKNNDKFPQLTSFEVALSETTNEDTLIITATARAGSSAPTPFDTVRVWATDPDAAQSPPAQFLVSVLNTPPRATPQPVDRLKYPPPSGQSDDMLTIDLNDWFEDDDGDKLTFDLIANSAPSVVQAIQNGSNLILTAVNSGEATVTVSATDTYNATTATDIVVTVNSSPKRNATLFPVDAMRPTHSFPIADLNDYFDDPNKDVLTFAVTSSAPEVIEVNTSGSSLRLEAKKVDSDTPVTITVTASDDYWGETSDSFIVTNVNTPPHPLSRSVRRLVYPPLNNQPADTVRLMLNNWFVDVDGDPLDFKVVSISDPAVASYTLSHDLLTITAQSGGVATLTVEADDAYGGLRTNQVTVTVNSPPDSLSRSVRRLVYPPPITQPADTVRLMLNNWFVDADGDPLDFKVVSISDPAVASYTLSNDLLIITAQGSGVATLTIEADDAYGGLRTNQVTVTVNSPPDSLSRSVRRLKYPPPITQPADTVRLMLNNWFVDVDGDPLDFKVAAHSDPTVVSYSLSNDLLTITAQARGTATLTIEADDSYGGLSAHQVTVTVNSLPVRNTTPFPVDYVRPNNPATIDNLNDFFDDPDMDVLAFTAANSDPDVISADILGSSLLLEPQKVDSDRRVIITITASDSFWGVIKIPYELTNVNSRPRPLAFTPVTMYPTQIKSIPFSTLFIDSDDDPLDYTASSENDSVAIAWTVADTLYIEAQKTDSTRVTTIHISADDGRSLSGPANADFMLTVNNSPIEVVPHAKVLLNFPPEGGENADVETINLADVFIDDDPLVYAIEAVQGDFADATLSGDGNSLILTAQSSGTSLVTVAADDQQGSYANFTFTVNVNTPPTLVQKDSLFSAFMGTNRLHFRIPLNYTQAIYLPHFFTDIDEDKIYYELVSDENNKSITAVILIDSLYVTAMGSGAAFVDVKPYDKRGSADSIRIPVQVNRQPQRIKDISDAKRKPGNRHVVPDIHSYFSDADNDRLTFSAQSSDEAIAMAWVANDTLYISSDGADSTSTVFITVSAKDDYGGYTATGFSITFQNKSPYPSSDWRDTLFDRNIFTGQQVSIQIGDIFLDDDGDPLALAAMSEDTSIVTARINDSTLILAAKGVGRCKATVSADDSYGGISALSFEVKVLSLSPIKKQDIADTVLTRGAPVPLTIDLYSRFADPLNNPLNFTVVSTADPKIAHASIQNDTILVIELDPAAPADASASISVYAKNDYGSEFTTFEIDVNVKPEIKQGKRIQNKWLKVGDKALKIDLSEIFEDEDVEDSLKFYAFSKNEQVAFALTSRDTLIVALNTPQPGDSAMIVYSADDAHDFGVKVDSFVVLPTARPPDISLYAEKDIQMSRGSPAVIRATVVDETAIDTSSVKIKYWHLDDSHEKAEQKGYLEDVNAKIYRFELPAEFFQDRSVVFQLYATNEYDSTGCSDIFVKPVHVNTLTRSEPQPLGTEQTAYRLVSFPLLLDNPSPRDVFAAWGTYNPTTWRLFETIYQDGEESFVEFQDIQQLQLGCAYWLITTQAGRKISTGPGQTAMPNDPDMLFEIPLHKGWNYVGNPFNFEIPLQNVRLAKSGKKEIRQFDAVGDGNVDWIKITPDSSFVPFQGYIFWSEFDEDTLLINPVVSDSLMANSETMAQHDTLWSINVAAQCQLANDRYNHAIVATDALTTLDILDEPEPPVFGQYVSVYFYQPEWDYPTNCFAADARPDINEGESWTLHARTNINDKIALTFAGMADVPDDYEVWLFDQALKITQDLRLDSIYTIAGSNAASPRALELVVGRPSYVNKLKQEMDLVPKDYVLFQNFPNPFNPSTTIRFGLPEDSDVTLKIYNILGEQVVSLLDHQHHRAGYHAVVWDGKNNHALLVSNGVYVYRLEAGSRTMVKKMAFVK